MATTFPATTAHPTTALGPIERAERLQVVDVLRGFALLGILMVNMALFKANAAFTPPDTAAAPIDQLASALILFGAEAKFYTLFSFLFGFGFSTWLARVGSPGRFARRLAILLVFGLLHATLLWSGDILVAYALYGFVLMLFRDRSPRALLIWATSLLAVGSVLAVLGLGMALWGQGVPETAAPMAEAERETRAVLELQRARYLDAYGRGSYGQVLGARLAELPVVYGYMLFAFPSILAMFLLGLYAGKRGLLREPEAHLGFWRRMLVWGLGLGFLAGAFVVYGHTQLGLFAGYFARMLNVFLAGPLQSLGYVAAILLLWQRSGSRRILRPLAAPGRMALSNYIGQTLICTTLFYGYGVGLFGQLGAALGILLALVIWTLQLVISTWWLQRFRFGPLEWLWRTLTYGRRQPMRSATAGD